jgi:hypothetical protein
VWQRRQLQHDDGDGAGHAIVGGVSVGVVIARFERDRNGCTVVDKNGLGGVARWCDASDRRLGPVDLSVAAVTPEASTASCLMSGVAFGCI